MNSDFVILLNEKERKMDMLLKIIALLVDNIGETCMTIGVLS